MITKNQINTMMQLQSQMNYLVNPGWMNAGYNWMRAVLVESVEAIEHHGYKWWKKQAVDMPQLHIELVDIWHFAISYMIEKFPLDPELENTILKSISENAQDVVYNNKTYSADQSILEDLQLMAGMAAFGDFSAALFGNLIIKTDYSWDKLFHSYLSKNVLNQFRQHNGYKDGSYIKDWSLVSLKNSSVQGRALEDNDHLHDAMLGLDKDDPLYVSTLLTELNTRYRLVCEA